MPQGKDSLFGGLERACRYSYPTNQRDYCGATGSHRAFEAFLAHPSEATAEKARALFPSFTGLYAYLELIAAANRREPLDEEIVEAYWLGNKLLENVSTEKVKEMIVGELGGKGRLLPSLAAEKAAALPATVFPHHSFHVLHVNFVSTKVDILLENLDKCLVKWGRVTEAREKELVLDGVALSHDGNGFSFEKATETVERGFVGDVNEGDAVGYHWRFGVEKIGAEQRRNLERFTRENIALVNGISKSR